MTVEKMLVALSNTTTVAVQYSPALKQWLAGTPQGSVFSPTLKEAVRAIYRSTTGVK